MRQPITDSTLRNDIAHSTIVTEVKIDHTLKYVRSLINKVHQTSFQHNFILLFSHKYFNTNTI